MIMSLDKMLWRGKARWTGTAKTGEDFEWFNNVPMFRYNAYFGIHTVHYMDLIGQTGGAPLPMNAIILAAIKTMLARTLAPTRGDEAAAQPLDAGLVQQAGQPQVPGLHRYGWLPLHHPGHPGPGGRPARADLLDRRLHRGTGRHPQGQPGGRAGHGPDDGRCAGARRVRGHPPPGGALTGSVKVDWVYNPMPPIAGQIYPPVELKPVVEF